jgi:hypothetical protein
MVAAIVTVTLTCCLIACRAAEPRTEAERLARSRKIIERMSAKLGGTPAFSMTMNEVRDEVRAKGEPQRVTLARETIVKRPNRMYSKVSGDRQNEFWYDGVGITLVMHKDKVFGQARAPETLDKTLDAISERYGMSMPLADYVYSSPAKALLTESTTGGWVGRETLEGRPADHLSFKDTGVKWDLWVAASGDPVPQRVVVEFPDDKRLRKVDATFKVWNLAPQIADDRFSPHVPPDYEGVAILQRARVLRNIPEDQK